MALRQRISRKEVIKLTKQNPVILVTHLRKIVALVLFMGATALFTMTFRTGNTRHQTAHPVAKPETSAHPRLSAESNPTAHRISLHPGVARWQARSRATQ